MRHRGMGDGIGEMGDGIGEMESPSCAIGSWFLEARKYGNRR